MIVHDLHDLTAPAPPAYCLSNGRYRVLMSAAGGGHSSCPGLSLDRWRGDPVEDAQGTFIYLREPARDRFWSLGFQPVKFAGADYRATYSPGRFTLEREDFAIHAVMEVAVAPDEDLEIRRVRLTNRDRRARRIELTSYVEVALHHPAADAAHPAFSKLFVQTERAATHDALLAWRRPSSAEESWPWLFHGLVGAPLLAWESDRARFIGRGRTLSAPAAEVSTDGLAMSLGSVLDPILSLRTSVDLPPGATREIAWLTGVAGDRVAAVDRIARHRDATVLAGVFSAAEASERDLWTRLGIGEAEADAFQRLAGALAYGHPGLRAATAVPAQSGDIADTLNRHGIGTDGPLLVARLGPGSPRLSWLATARRYWEARGLSTRLVLLWPGENDFDAAAVGEGAFVLPPGALSPGDSERLWAAAQLAIAEDARMPWDDPGPAVPPAPSLRVGEAGAVIHVDPAPADVGDGLTFFNAYGGFSEDGSEYVIRLPRRGDGPRLPPLPWINVVANERCGFLVSERGAGYTWCRNSRENRLTPWSNDPVIDPHGEAYYIRDDETGEFWSPVPGPAPAPCDYEVRHGFGYSRFLCSHRGLVQETHFFVPQSDPVRIVRLRLTGGVRPRRLSLFAYHGLVLGSGSEWTSDIVTDHDPATDTLRAVNRRAGDFAGGVAFAFATVAGAAVERRHLSGDRLSFIGRNGSLADPIGVRAGRDLDDAVGAGLDPCFAWQWVITLAPAATAECSFFLGECQSLDALNDLVGRYRQGSAVTLALRAVSDHWRSLLGAVRIETPVPEVDLMMNGWIAYQTLACRLLARSAFYQSGGALGFRDQLQDAAALVYHQPAIARAQILLHAAHQFGEGDVLHWWHPDPMERGLRTRMSDDLLWLPYVTSFYVSTTGDFALLEERVPYLEAEPLRPGEHDRYFKPDASDTAGDIYDHCCRAIDRSLTRGVHGLPLMGTGDWNDGMNRVGCKGQGESVWLGFFLYHVLGAFMPLCRRRGDGDRAGRYARFRVELGEALDAGGWDGAWYRRAYFDDGTPLGSRDSEECRIDVLPQAWAVISKAAPQDKAEEAMDALTAQLVSEGEGLIRLLTPPFVAMRHDPGYIKGYVAGIRENGGQYTHAACWAARAAAELRRTELAARLIAMLSPISHARTPEAVQRYRVEPYIIAADIYGVAPHVGRGGWTWYTGSAGWYLRVVLESLLGFTVEGGDTLVLRPAVPRHWPRYAITYRVPGYEDCYAITVENPDGLADRVASAEMDGAPVAVVDGAARIPLTRQGLRHTVTITLGGASH